jgi:hypothetical protein
MPSTSEKGHAKNIANFKKFIIVCQGYGAKYNPTKTSIKVANLQTRYTQVFTMLDDIKTAVTTNKTAINNRKVGFKGYRKYSTRILSALKATDATPETIDNAISINKKIQGERITAEKKAKPTGDSTTPPEDTSISTSQQSYTNIVDHYKKLKTLLVAQAAVYAPNETDLQTATVTTYATNLETLNNSVDTTNTALSNQRIARNHSFYDDTTGLIDTINAAKDYIASVYGKTSPEYKLASAIQFSKPK